MAKKATNYEIIQRVTLVIDFLLDGLSRYEIQEYARNEWDLSRSPVDVYIGYANKRIERMASKVEQKAFDRIRVRLERQYRRAIQGKKKDGRLALLILDKMCKLYGLDKPIKVAPTTPDGLNEFTGISEARQRVEEGLDRILAGLNSPKNGKRNGRVAEVGTGSGK